MKFLCLAYGAEKDWKALTKDEQDALLAQDDVLRKRGALMAAVEPAVKTVRAWDGTPSVTAGAFGQSDVPLAGSLSSKRKASIRRCAWWRILHARVRRVPSRYGLS